MRPRFLCDAMVGKLARGLRMLGYDVLYIPDISDTELIRFAVAEERILLTKDTKLRKKLKKIPYFLINGDDWEYQLSQVVRQYKLNTRELFGRCLICGNEVVEVPRESVKGKVPPYTYKTHKRFRRCSVCEKIYWYGGHLRRMRAQIKEIMEKTGC